MLSSGRRRGAESNPTGASELIRAAVLSCPGCKRYPTVSAGGAAVDSNHLPPR